MSYLLQDFDILSSHIRSLRAQKLQIICVGSGKCAYKCAYGRANVQICISLHSLNTRWTSQGIMNFIISKIET